MARNPLELAAGEARMTDTVTELESKALRLTPEDRVLLADRLLASISTDRSIDQAWAIESQRRLAELEAGTVVAVPLGMAVERARNATR